MNKTMSLQTGFMKTSATERLFSVFLILTLTCSLFIAAPKDAHAMTASELVSHINSFNPGVLDRLQASASGNTVTVTGTVSGATNTLVLNINSGVTVRWEASYTGSAWPLIRLSGDGTFEVPEGGLISGSGSSIISLTESSNTVSVTVSGGIVRNTNTNYSNAISGSIGSTNNITVTGGEVSSISGYAITVSGNVSVSGGTVSTESDSSSAINVYNASNTVTVTGGTVSATRGQAIRCDDPSSTVTMSGNSFVFAWGTNLDLNNNDVLRGTPNTSGNAIICAWNQGAETTTYLEGTSTHLTWITFNSGATVKWARNGSQSGISYAKGTNTGFIPITGVTVNAPAPTTCSVTFKYNNGQPDWVQTVNAGSTADYGMDPIRAGYTFAGWFADLGLTNAYNFNNPVTANITLYAKWTAVSSSTYSVTVISGTASPTSAAAGTTINITANAAPAGKVFDRWTSPSGVTFVNATSTSTSFTMPSNAVTVTATYKDVSTNDPNPPSNNNNQNNNNSNSNNQNNNPNNDNSNNSGDNNNNSSSNSSNNSDSTINDDNGNMTWLWVALGALALLAAAGVITFFVIKKKKKDKAPGINDVDQSPQNKDQSA